MSSYTLEKVVRFKIEESRFLKLLNIEDIWDLETHSYFGNGEVGKFQIAPTEDFFVDFVLNVDSGNSDYGRTRELTSKEFEKYVKIFRSIIPESEPIPYDKLRLVEFCWYNASEAPNYFNDSTYHDDFYDEV